MLKTIYHSPTETWQKALADVITDPQELFAQLNIDFTLLPAAYKANQLFKLRVPRSFVARMQHNDLNDPLLKQVLPLGDELLAAPGYTCDPLQEANANFVPGILHKYYNRVLLMITGGCAIHCRYCFRRHFPYNQNGLGKKNLTQAIAYIAAHKEINEVIYSGGDPFIAKDKTLAEITTAITAIPHIKRLRIHTRLPIVIPERINADLIHWLTQTRLQPIIVMHCNHANEIDDNVALALQKLRTANITLLNQSVLLKNINDNETTLIRLSERLFAVGVLPYYLHLLDKVQGAAHFDVNEETARQLIKNIMLKLPGYLVPKLVREIANAGTKTQINL